MQREIFTAEHDAFRDMVRAFIAREITPYHEQWERDGVVSRDVWLAAEEAALGGERRREEELVARTRVSFDLMPGAGVEVPP